MNVQREISTHGKYCEANPTATINMPRFTLRSAARRHRQMMSAANPVHHTAGLPMQEMEDTISAGMKSAPE